MTNRYPVGLRFRHKSELDFNYFISNVNDKFVYVSCVSWDGMKYSKEVPYFHEVAHSYFLDKTWIPKNRKKQVVIVC